MKARNTVGLLVIVIFFGLPFAAISVAALVSAAGAARTQHWRQAMVSGLAGALLGAVGFGILAAAFFRWKPQVQGDRLRAAHPDKPWLWRADWAEGRVRDATMSTMWLLWWAAICVNMITLPLAGLIFCDVLAYHNFRALIGLIFPCAGVALMFWAMQVTARYRRFGRSIFVMSTVPGTVGGKIAGAIEFQKPLPGNTECRMELRCVRRVGKKVSRESRPESETELWCEERTARLDTDGMLPVEFDVPPKAHETSMQNPHNRIVWRLELEAPTPGIKYTAWFEVPVFKASTEGSSEPCDRP